MDCDEGGLGVPTKGVRMPAMENEKTGRQGTLAGVIPLVLVAVLLPLTAGCRPATPELHGDVPEEITPAAEIAGPNWDGSEFKLSDHRGEVSVVMFGYTYCPDVCPITLSKLQKVHRQLEDPEGLNVVFVSVDPERDSLEKLAGYVPNFDPEFYGVYLEGAGLQEVMDGYSVISEKRLSGASNRDFYYVDHTSTLFVVDRHGDLRLRIPMNAPVEDLAADLETLLAEQPT